MLLPDAIVEPAITLKDQYFDLKGLSVYSALGIGTLRDHIREGALPCFKVKGKILIKRSEFDKWMDSYQIHKKKDIQAVITDALNTQKESKSNK